MKKLKITFGDLRLEATGISERIMVLVLLLGSGLYLIGKAGIGM